MNQRRVRRCLPAIAAALYAHTAIAWDGQTTGKIAVIEATSLNNYAFRIWLEGSPVMCSGGHRWAYVDVRIHGVAAPTMPAGQPAGRGTSRVR